MLHNPATSNSRSGHDPGRPEPLVYVVDDEPGLRHSSCFLIAALGLSCLQFEDGCAFLDALDHLDPGCVLLDVTMRRLSGLEVQDEMIRRGMNWPIIFMSGAQSVPNMVEGVRKGAIEFLEKPFEEERLLAALHRGFVALRNSRS